MQWRGPACPSQEQSRHIQPLFMVWVRNCHSLYQKQVLTNAFDPERLGRKSLACKPLLTKARGRVPRGSSFPVPESLTRSTVPASVLPMKFSRSQQQPHSLFSPFPVLSSTQKGRDMESCCPVFAGSVSSLSCPRHRAKEGAWWGPQSHPSWAWKQSLIVQPGVH